MMEAKMDRRFTRDGSDDLEALLEQLCGEVVARLGDLIPEEEIEGIVLGGGYGRGEGGVLAAVDGDQPYNDLEFFILVRGSILMAERRYGDGVREIGHALTDSCGIEVEFKISSLRQLMRSGGSMFFYDLVCGHRVVAGPADLLEPCGQHRDARRIPHCEALRLLMNRCSGLLFAQRELDAAELGSDAADFIRRNIAKAELAIGDVILAARGMYHWSCLERHQRLLTLEVEDLPMGEIRVSHQAGVDFKLHPRLTRLDQQELLAAHRQISRVAWQVWQWLEGQRLGSLAKTPWEYVCLPGRKCPETSRMKNLLIRIRTFGLAGIMPPRTFCYPRESILNTLPLLLWGREGFEDEKRFIGMQLQAEVDQWSEGVSAYEKLWNQFN